MVKTQWKFSVNENQDGLAGNVDKTTAQQNVIQLDTVVQPQIDSTMFFANTHTVPQPAISIHVRNEQSVVRVQPDTLYNSRSLPNQITSTVPPANIMTNGSASSAEEALVSNFSEVSAPVSTLSVFPPPNISVPVNFFVQRPNVSVSAPSTSLHPFTTGTLPTTHYEQSHIVGGGPPHPGGPSNVPLLGNSGNPTISLLENFFEKQMCHESLPKLELDVFEGDQLKWPKWYGLFAATCCNPTVSFGMRMR